MSQMQENVIENNLLVNQHVIVNGGNQFLITISVNLHLYYCMISFSLTRNKYDGQYFTLKTFLQTIEF